MNELIFLTGFVSEIAVVLFYDNIKMSLKIRKNDFMGYQPLNDTLDARNPPRGGSGVPDKNYPDFNTNDRSWIDRFKLAPDRPEEDD